MDNTSLKTKNRKKRKKRLANRFTNSVGNPMHSTGT